MDWIQTKYVDYCTHSHFCHHKDPESVKFGLLGVQWDIVDNPEPTKKRRRRS
jgi:hypothetical protein